MTDSPLDNPSYSNRFLLVAWTGVTALCGWFEFGRFEAALESPVGAVAWFTSWDAETSLPFVVLLALPVLVLFPDVRRHRAEPSSAGLALSNSRLSAMAALVFCVSLGASMAVGLKPVTVRTGVSTRDMRFAELPPAYHDEYSYLVQAETFAAGRLSWPPMTVRPDLFHQMHVLNERRTASRYFPTTGLWIAPFLQTGYPIAGHWLAGALAATFFYLGAARLLRAGTALVAGLLIAVSPGIAVFSNLLLSHHPTLLALSVFFFAMIRLRQSPSVWVIVLAGISLTLAMLGRPMTAAGFALPWGFYFGWQLFVNPGAELQERRISVVAGLAIPLAMGFISLGIINQNITGSVFRSPYQEYTDTYTPRHAYGFNNGERGDAMQGPKVLTDYDRWAANLTWSVAWGNVKNRVLASAQWCLGIIPVLFGLLLAFKVALPGSPDDDDRRFLVRMLFAGIVSLHAVHVPYWYDGIMHWHYVFETAPLILILVAVGLAEAVSALVRHMSRRRALLWTAALTLSALLPGWVSWDATWGISKTAAAVSELSYARTRFALFQRLVESDAVPKPALILVDESAGDPQLSYVINDPEMKSDVLVARRPGTTEEIGELRAAFPERQLYDFNPATFRIRVIR